MVAADALISYGVDTKALNRVADLYIDKILKGTKDHEAFRQRPVQSGTAGVTHRDGQSRAMVGVASG